MTLKTEFFLGANSAEGFYSLYDQLREGERMRDLIVLKGGPGVGKSTFMRCIGNQAEEKGLQIEYIRCSGDPDSLDAVWLPQLGTAVVDGTAPHVVEPAYPAAVGRYVNLGQFYNVDRLKERRREIVACTNGYQAEYRKAYACLHACGAVRAEMEGSAGAGFDYEKLRRRLKNIWQRERGKKRGGIGREQHRFLGGLTPAGRWWCTDSLFALCGRIYDLQDSYHLTAVALEELRGIVCADGFDVLLCLDPDCPARIAHLLIPQLSLAFVTTDHTFVLPEKAARRVRVEAMMDRERLRTLRGGLRLKRRLAEALEEEGAEHLRLAGEKHKELELIYHPFVDFDGVMDLAARESRRIFGA